MKKLEIVKTVVNGVVMVGVGSIMSQLLSGRAKDANGLMKICIVIGGIALSGLVIDKTLTHTNEAIDIVTEDFKKIKVEEV